VFRNVSKWGKAKPSREWGWEMFKMGTSDITWAMGAMFLYHNTIMQPDGHGMDGGIIPTTTSNRQHFVTSRNNILHVRTTSILTDAATMPNSTFDYDLCSGDVPEGSEQHGLLNETPSYISGTNTLEETSPGFDDGVVLWNFNDRNSAWPYYGAAPDIGAVEADDGTPVRRVNPAFAMVTANSLYCRRAGHVLVIAGNLSGSYLVSLRDVSGRIVVSFAGSGLTEKTVPLSGLPKGVYLVTMRANGFFKTARLIFGR
jgi:hypothetical protein